MFTRVRISGVWSLVQTLLQLVGVALIVVFVILKEVNIADLIGKDIMDREAWFYLFRQEPDVVDGEAIAS
jgi:hypothetical protein